MTRGRRATAIASNPVLVGVATTLVTVVAVFLAYNANAGLPWVPSYRLTAEVPDAANLVKGNEVRIGGLRVGVVDKITPLRKRDGSVSALLNFKLETRVKPLPIDSSLIIRPRSALGLKYVQVTKGHSGQGFADGARIPLASATPKPVEIDQVYSMFDKKTRDASQTNLKGFGDAFAGRGEDLNLAIEDLVPLLGSIEPVFRNLAAPDTRLNRFFKEQGDAAAIVAPAAETLAELWVNLDTTFTALAEVARPFIQESISKGPSGLDTATRTFPRIRPFFRNTEQFFAELRPGTQALRSAAPDLADAFVTGTPTLRRSVAFNARLEGTFRALERFSRDPLVPLGIRALIHTVESLDPTLSFVTPAQTVCNYAALWFRNIASLLSEGDANGTWVRFNALGVLPEGPNNEGGPSSAPANGPNPDNYLHVNPYPNTAAPGQTRECEAGKEPYAPGKQVIGNVPGGQGTSTDEQKQSRR